jgi:hypothetical protein
VAMPGHTPGSSAITSSEMAAGLPGEYALLEYAIPPVYRNSRSCPEVHDA